MWTRAAAENMRCTLHQVSYWGASEESIPTSVLFYILISGRQRNISKACVSKHLIWNVCSDYFLFLFLFFWILFFCFLQQRGTVTPRTIKKSNQIPPKQECEQCSGNIINWEHLRAAVCTRVANRLTKTQMFSHHFINPIHQDGNNVPNWQWQVSKWSYLFHHLLSESYIFDGFSCLRRDILLTFSLLLYACTRTHTHTHTHTHAPFRFTLLWTRFSVHCAESLINMCGESFPECPATTIPHPAAHLPAHHPLHPLHPLSMIPPPPPPTHIQSLSYTQVSPLSFLLLPVTLTHTLTLNPLTVTGAQLEEALSKYSKNAQTP